MALVVSAALYKPIGYFIADIIHLHRVGVSVVVFILLFIGLSYLFALAGQALTRMTKKIELAEINNVLGALFGGLKGAFICGVILAVLIENNLLGALTIHVKKALLTPFVVQIAHKLLHLFGF